MAWGFFLCCTLSHVVLLGQFFVLLSLPSIFPCVCFQELSGNASLGGIEFLSILLRIFFFFNFLETLQYRGWKRRHRGKGCYWEWYICRRVAQEPWPRWQNPYPRAEGTLLYTQDLLKEAKLNKNICNWTMHTTQSPTTHREKWKFWDQRIIF